MATHRLFIKASEFARDVTGVVYPKPAPIEPNYVGTPKLQIVWKPTESAKDTD